MNRLQLTAVAGGALAMLLAGAALPLWTMTLHAPQYPQGVRLIIDGRGARGDVDELNTLNHYIGMRPIPGAEPGEDRERSEGLEEVFPELRLFTPGVAMLALGHPGPPLRRVEGIAPIGRLGSLGAAVWISRGSAVSTLRVRSHAEPERSVPDARVYPQGDRPNGRDELQRHGLAGAGADPLRAERAAADPGTALARRRSSCGGRS